jgi:ATP-dependent DNA helicase PIF1
MPIVVFSNGQKQLIDRVWSQSEEYPSIGVGQLPLCLAWALTIHKIQGATLTLAEMDLGNSVFEFGQTYVALSRIRNLEGLYLSAFQPKRIKANPLVKDFYRNIPELLDEVVIENPFADYACKELEIESYEDTSQVKIIRL